ncbi:unnamed protein product [Ectocarpus sp. CCAP 1310/34]|nr:unnamed protein product [Ectocarpus sp. CCAP 1310/34]
MVRVLASCWMIVSLVPGACFLVPTNSRAALHSAGHRQLGQGYRDQQPSSRQPRNTGAGRREVVRAMFSGIVEEMGSVASLVKNEKVKLWDGSEGAGVELTVKANTVLEGATEGCSIAVNGVCLTVTSFNGDEFKVGLAPETLRRSNLEDLRAGDEVNLERALPVDGRNSGHFVQGHVDNVGTILSMEADEDSLVVKVEVPQDLVRYIAPKGFIAVDGTSLTVCEVNNQECWFTFMLVAYTQQHVVIPKKSKGDKVNLEVDVLGKYVERSLSSVLDRLGALEDWRETADRKLASSKDGAKVSEDIDFKIRHVEHKVKNRDMVLDVIENRLARLEAAEKQKA